MESSGACYLKVGSRENLKFKLFSSVHIRPILSILHEPWSYNYIGLLILTMLNLFLAFPHVAVSTFFLPLNTSFIDSFVSLEKCCWTSFTKFLSTSHDSSSNYTTLDNFRLFFVWFLNPSFRKHTIIVICGLKLNHWFAYFFEQKRFK